MTNKDYTHIELIVDRSGSMFGVHEELEKGIAALLAEQIALPGKLTVGVATFDNVLERQHSFAPAELVEVKIQPRGGTALNDAVGLTVNWLGQKLKAMPEDERPDKVLVAIVTDGYENASREYTAQKVKALVQEQQAKYDWDFTYLGANQDAVFVAGGYGIAAGSALTFNAQNFAVATASLNSYTTATRSGLAAGYSEEDRAKNA